MPIYHAHMTGSSHTPWHLLCGVFISLFPVWFHHPLYLVYTPESTAAYATGMGPFIPFLPHHPTISFCNSSGWVYFSGCLAPMFPALIQPTWLYLFIFPEWNPKHDVFLFKILSVATAKWINFSLQHSRLWVSIYLSQYFSNLANLMYILLYYIPYIQDFVHTIFFYWNVLPSSLPLKILTFSLDKFHLLYNVPSRASNLLWTIYVSLFGTLLFSLTLGLLLS